MASKDFYEERTPASIIKSEIVRKYFFAWARIMIKVLNRQYHLPKKIAYIDLFSGPGAYKNGTPSTPIEMIKEVLDDELLRKHVILVFNDKEMEYTQELEKEIRNVEGIERLAHAPVVLHEVVGDNIAIELENKVLVPTFSFLDPIGYKGLSRRLIHAVLKDWGCDTLFFFNYNRILMGITNPKVEKPLADLLGSDRLDALRATIPQITSSTKKEQVILEALTSALQEIGCKFLLHYCFRFDDRDRTSHYLIYVTKHKLGYKIMKNIMANASTNKGQWLPSYRRDPRDRKLMYMLFDPTYQPKKLEKELIAEFCEQTLIFEEIYDQHGVGRPYLRKHYREVLGSLEKEGKITVNPPLEKRQLRDGQPTFGNKVKVTFPPLSNGE